MSNILLFGAAPLTSVLYSHIKDCGKDEVCAFVVDEAFKQADEFCGLELVSTESVRIKYPPDRYKMLVAVGYNKLNAIRKEKYLQMKSFGYQLLNFLHPSNMIASSAEIGENVILMEGNVIQPYSKVGNNVVMFSQNVVGHNAVIGDHSFLSSQVIISGDVTIGERCFFGAASGVEAFVNLGDNCILDAHAWVSKDAAENGVYQAPATIRRKAESLRVRLK